MKMFLTFFIISLISIQVLAQGLPTEKVETARKLATALGINM